MRTSNFECLFEGCKRIYNSQKNLDKHTEMAHGEKTKFECSYCNRVLSSRQNLREHIYVHTGETPYVCQESGCSASFRQGSQLSAHKKLHRAIRTATSHLVLDLKLTHLIARNGWPETRQLDINGMTEMVELPPLTGVVQEGPLPPFNLR